MEPVQREILDKIEQTLRTNPEVQEEFAGGRGDLVVTIVVDTPTRLDSRQEELLRELSELRGEENPDAHVTSLDKGLLGKLRDAFR